MISSRKMKRVLAQEAKDFIGKEIVIQGWVRLRRDHGKLIFLDIRDRSGIIQVVVNPQISDEAHKTAKELGAEFAVQIKGKVNERPGKAVNEGIDSGAVELEASEIKILAKAGTLPFDMGGGELKLELPTLLDNRGLTLRHPKIAAIFKVQAAIIDEFRNFLKEHGFIEFQAPSIAPAVAEGGAAVFEVNYFGHKAYLSQSPQLYKQIVVSAFERVFSVNKVFRAEPSVTTRHLTEVVSLDAEMAFIDSWEDVKDMADEVVRSILKRLEKDCAKELKMYGVDLPKMIDKTPFLSLREAQERIFKNSGRDVRSEKDLNPEDEREISDIIRKETGSDFVFIYGYPTKHKPFYVYPNPDNPEFNEGMDLLCKGLEWASGGRRINDYDQLMEHVKIWKLDPDKIKLFLDAFKYGVPPEGGFALGAERMTMQILELGNVREASIFPRDMERIDEKLTPVKKP